MGPLVLLIAAGVLGTGAYVATRPSAPQGPPKVSRFAGQLRLNQWYRLGARISPTWLASLKGLQQAIILNEVKGAVESAGFAKTQLVTQDPTDPEVFNVVSQWSLSTTETFDVPDKLTFFSLQAVETPPSVIAATMPAPPPTLDAGIPFDDAIAVAYAIGREADPKHLTTFATTLLPDFPVSASLLNAKAKLLSLGRAQPAPVTSGMFGAGLFSSASATTSAAVRSIKAQQSSAAGIASQLAEMRSLYLRQYTDAVVKAVQTVASIKASVDAGVLPPATLAAANAGLDAANVALKLAMQKLELAKPCQTVADLTKILTPVPPEVVAMVIKSQAQIAASKPPLVSNVVVRDLSKTWPPPFLADPWSKFVDVDGQEYQVNRDTLRVMWQQKDYHLGTGMNPVPAKAGPGMFIYSPAWRSQYDQPVLVRRDGTKWDLFDTKMTYPELDAIVDAGKAIAKGSAAAFDVAMDAANLIKKGVDIAISPITTPLNALTGALVDATGGLGKTAQGIWDPIAKTAQDVANLPSVAVQQAHDTLKDIGDGRNVLGAITDHLSQAGVAFAKAIKEVSPFLAMIPGIGTGLAVMLSVAASIALGESLSDAALDGLASAIPGGPIVQDAFKAAVVAGLALAKGERFDKAMAEGVRAGLPSEAARIAFDAGLALAQGKSLQDAGFAGLNHLCAGNTLAEKAANFGEAVVIAKQTGQSVEAVLVNQAVANVAPLGQDALENQLKPLISQVAASPVLQALNPQQLADKVGVSTVIAQAAQQAVRSLPGGIGLVSAPLVNRLFPDGPPRVPSSAITLVSALNRPGRTVVSDPAVARDRVAQVTQGVAAGDAQALAAKVQLDRAANLIERSRWVEQYKRLLIAEKGGAPVQTSGLTVSGHGILRKSGLSLRGRLR